MTLSADLTENQGQTTFSKLGRRLAATPVRASEPLS